MNDESVMGLAREVLQAACDADLKLVTAESCTGGLLSAVLTEVEGLSHVFERGFTVYTDDAKREVLGVDGGTLERCSAVSGACAQQMAVGALEHSHGDVAVSITGYADAPEDAKDAGLVYFGLYVRGHGPLQFEERFNENSRARVRLASILRALELLKEGIGLAVQERAHPAPQQADA